MVGAEQTQVAPPPPIGTYVRVRHKTQVYRVAQIQEGNVLCRPVEKPTASPFCVTAQRWSDWLTVVPDPNAPLPVTGPDGEEAEQGDDAEAEAEVQEMAGNQSSAKVRKTKGKEK